MKKTKKFKYGPTIVFLILINLADKISEKLFDNNIYKYLYWIFMILFVFFLIKLLILFLLNDSNKNI